MRRRISVLTVVILFLGAICLCAVNANRVRAGRFPSATQGGSERTTITMRSLVPGASGMLLLRARSRQVRLSTHGLPRPESIDPRAHVFMVWAVGADSRIVKLGQLMMNAEGGALAFTIEAALEPYSVIVTAEQNALAVRPSGVPVLSTRAREIVTPQPLLTNDDARQGHERTVNDARAARAGATRASARVTTPDFYSIVDAALGSGRTLTLTGAGGVVPSARGVARIAVLNGTAFVRARLVNLPSPVRLGASEYIVWGRLRDGRTIYMGTLPASGFNGNDVYVRLNNANFEDFQLFVTAERTHPALFPSGRRVLVTRENAFRTRHLRRRHRRHRHAR
ncbi:MAG TPA: hypothetical protein VK619_05355 [Pyrinomonadaceae bacterium]|nr:hypothetical protein [Pyrinomonadaceae bacterium]